MKKTWRSKLMFRLCLICAVVGTGLSSFGATVNVFITTNEIPKLLGYMNWYTNMAAYNADVSQGGSAWGWPDLPATFNTNNGTLTMSPNTSTYNPADPYWVNPDGSGAKVMEANFYAQNDAYAGSNIVFQGYCWANTLTNNYKVQAFIKMFNDGYTAYTSVRSNLTYNGQYFRIALIGNPSYPHVQWGYLLAGTNANPATAAALGNIVLANYAQPTNVVITVPPADKFAFAGSNVTFAVTAFGANLNYQWKKDGATLANSGHISGATTATLTVSNVTTNDAGIYTVIVTNSFSGDTGSGRLTVVDPNNLIVDASAPWVGYMNWYTNINNQQGTYVAGSTWGVPDLQARFGAGTLTLLPNTNTYNPADPYWVFPNGQGAMFMEALLYQQWDGLAGQTITFNGECLSNTLAGSYTARAYIREFLSDYSAFDDTQVPLVDGQPFSVTRSTGVGNHVQWGFVMVGTNASPGSLPSLGKVVLQATTSVVTPPNQPTLAAHLSGGLVGLTFSSQSGYTYTVEYKTNVTGATWQTLSTTNGTGSAITVLDTPTGKARFYRVSAE